MDDGGSAPSQWKEKYSRRRGEQREKKGALKQWDPNKPAGNKMLLIGNIEKLDQTHTHACLGERLKDLT